MGLLQIRWIDGAQYLVQSCSHLGLIDGKWKSIVLFHLLSGTLRFNEIRRHIANVTPRMLTDLPLNFHPAAIRASAG
ncbi:helix-turn-helix transcriptional regulator, partial [Mesorhizobium sp. CGMCC 1.15528]